MSQTIDQLGFGRFATLFSSILLIILSLAASYSAGRIEEQFQNHRMAELDKLLDKPIAETSEIFYITRRIRALNQAAIAHTPGSVMFHNEVNKIEQESVSMKLFLLHDLNLQESFFADAYEERIIEQTVQGLAMHGEEFKTRQRTLHKDLLTLLGAGSRLEALSRARGLLRQFTHNAGKGFFYWDHLTDKVSVFYIFTSIPDFISRFTAVRGQNPGRLGAAVPARDIWLPPEGTDIDQMKTAFRKAAAENRPITDYAGQDWVFAQNPEGSVWCLAENKVAKSPATAYQIGSKAGFILSVILLLTYFMANMKFLFAVRLLGLLNLSSIRTRLITVFAMASVIPLGLALMIGATTLSDRREVLINETSKESLERIHRIENAYKQKLDDFAKLSRQIRNSEMVIESQVDRLASYVNDLMAQGEIQRFETRDRMGNVIYSTDDPEVHGVSRAMDAFSKNAIRLHSPHRLGPGFDKVTPEELLSESFMSTDAMGLATILRRPAKIWTFTTGGTPAYWFWDVYPDLATGPAFIMLAHQLDRISRNQIPKIMAAKVDPEADNILIAIPYANEGAGMSSNPPVSGEEFSEFQILAARSHATRRVIIRETLFRGKLFWTTVKTDGSFGLYVILDLVPVDKKLQSLMPVRRMLQMVSLLTILISGMSAGLISLLFIAPVSDLGRGIQAIKQRNSEFRIVPRRKDEFGKLAVAFNNLLQDMKELQYGRVVQESLLPTDLTPPDGYEIECIRKTANDLGGDYHDLIRLSENQLLIIVGDVTGHGISAALAVAMAKASVDYQVYSNIAFPSEALNQINSLFFRELKPQKKFMTLGCLVLDPINHNLKFENAGHPYPMVYRKADNIVSELSGPSLPLGTRKKRLGGPSASSLEPGDAILMFSDGYFECTDKKNKAFGYSSLSNLFAELMRSGISTRELNQKLLETLDAFRAPGPYPDDVTILVIKRIR